MMAERGLELARTTIMRWVQRYVPEFEKSWARYGRKVGRSWRINETYLKVRPMGLSLPRRGQGGQYSRLPTSPRRDIAAAKAFFRKALHIHGRAPISITLDAYAASHRAVREMPSENEVWKRTKLRTSKYLNNLVEQDHREIKSRTGPMLGFKRFDYVAITIVGVELLRRIHKGQVALRPLRLKDQAVPAIWMLACLHRSILLQNITLPIEIICTRARFSTRVPDDACGDPGSPHFALPASAGKQMVQMKNRVSGLLMETGVEYSKQRLHELSYFRELLSTNEEAHPSIRPLLKLSRETIERCCRTQRGGACHCLRSNRRPITVAGLTLLVAVERILPSGDAPNACLYLCC
jgi:transposase-like protein